MTDKQIISNGYNSLARDCSSELDTPLTSQIIIDGVDVSGCEHRCDTHKTLLADGHIKEFENYCQITNDGCYAINCYYKQHKRKEQECERLKHNYEAIKQCNDNNMQTLDEAIKEKEVAEQKLEKVEKQYKCYSCGTCNGKEDYYNLAGHHENAIKSLHKTYEQLDQLKAENESLKKQLQFEFDETLLQYSNTIEDLQKQLNNTVMQKCPQCGEVYLNPVGCELHEENQQLKAENKTQKETIDGFLTILDKLGKSNIKLREILAEIKEIVEKGVKIHDDIIVSKKILHKISEIEDEN